MRNAIRFLCAAALVLLLGGHVQAQTSGSHPIVVEHPWARATPGGAKTGAAYLTLVNKSDATDQLLGASTPAADKVQFHSTTEENGVSRMREMQVVDLPPRAKVTFDPRAMHMMLVGLKQPLREGQTFPLTLTFAKAGKVDVTVPVAKVGAMQPGDMGAMTHGPGGMMKK
jgi:copper(I)-binding protein